MSAQFRGTVSMRTEHMLPIFASALLVVVASCVSVRSSGVESSVQQVTVPDVTWDVVKSDSGYAVVAPDEQRFEILGRLAMVFTSSASWDPAWVLEVKGVTYTLALDPRGHLRIQFIETTDSRFRSPEGAAKGDQYKDLLEVGAGVVREEPGWACFVCLPSAWGAVLHRDYCDRGDDSSKVLGFFQRRGTCDHPSWFQPPTPPQPGDPYYQTQ